MNTGRELLEAAAKAAGLNVKAERVDADDRFIGLIVGPKHTKLKVDWNPLNDDGDALRLAVKLNLWQAMRDGYQHLDSDNDILSATRRAIVRAAAAMTAG